ncbi:MAG: DUF2499 domain-containing protein [Gloeomargaritaceae cyanobacterium C42_A2020_066]|nr:DUF2499 domain-containing protein [Gloeomargaritaceae cyanobacterium C42_A2020_066]
MHSLSLPTWVIHVSSVLEWAVAMALVWQYAQQTGRPAWRWLAWAMVPALGSAFAACTWHFFENAPSLEGLVTLQASLTVVGNCTLCLAAWQIHRRARIPDQS